MEKTIYDLELHESITADFGMVIMRVAGGWIYDCWNIDTDRPQKGTFVPFNNEFQVVKKSGDDYIK